MIFTTLPFLIFFALVVPLYWLLPSDRWRLPLLFAANFLFYGWWDWRFTALLLFVVCVCHWGGRALAGILARGGDARLALYFFCGIQLCVLGTFKYVDFFLGSVAAMVEQFGGEPGWTTLNVILPVGISFYIFQAISYLVSVFRGTVACERSFLKLGVYLGFFPHLVAGPIIHAKTFLPQLAARREFRPAEFLDGLRKFAIGFLYKSVFADNLAGPVDAVFRDPAAQDGLTVLGGCLGFYGQIYFDFAGYSLMAIGVANMIGYSLPDNFRFPYRAASVIDFWRRWHISLSTWLRDYVYIPLGGSRGPRWTLYRNLMITMFLGGLWHGASWNFVLWGCLHGLALCINHVWSGTSSARRLEGSIVFAILSFLAVQGMVLLCWIPFRAESFEDSLVLLSKLGEVLAGNLSQSTPFPWLLALVPLLADTWLVGSEHLGTRIQWRSRTAFAAVVALAFLVGLLCMHIGYAPFIYFQF